MPIVLISESLLRRRTATDGRLLRDRVLCGFCVRMNPRKRTFRIATSVAGEQFRGKSNPFQRRLVQKLAPGSNVMNVQVALLL